MTVQEVLALYFTEMEMAQLLEVTKATLQTRRCRGENHPPFIKIGKSVRYPKAEYFKWEKAHPLQVQIAKPLRAVK